MLLMRDDGTHYRVEVKTTSKAKGDPRKADGGGATRYSFNTATGSGAKTRLDPTAVDMLCLVALDVRRVYFKPVFRHEVLRYNLTPEKILGVDELTQLNETLEDIDMWRLQCGVV